MRNSMSYVFVGLCMHVGGASCSFFGDHTARKHVFSLDIETVKGSFVIQLGTERMSTTYPSPANAIDKLEW